MKIEKAQKHMDKRTVVVGEDSRDHTVGVITTVEEDLNYPIYVTGRVVFKAGGESSSKWTRYSADKVRKATDEEREAFFAWLREDGSELCKDGFARLGGAPRGFEPEGQPYKVGDMVRLRDGAPGETHISPTFFAPGSVVKILSVGNGASGFSYTAHGRTIHDGERGQLGLAHRDIVGVAVATPRILDASADMDQRRAAVGKRVRVIRSISGMNHGKIGVVAEVDGSSTPYRVEHETGNAWAKEIEILSDEAAPSKPEKKTEEIAAEQAKAFVSQRPSKGDTVIAVREGGGATIGRITRDDHDQRPFVVEGATGYYDERHVFPLTLDGFRAAHAKQAEYGINPEDGDYVGIFRHADYLFGVYYGGAVWTPASGGGGRTLIKGGQDWSDRVVVTTKKPA